MDQDEFVLLALVGLGLVISSFFVLGFSRVVVGFSTAQRLAAPIGVLGFGLVVYLFLRATLSAAGIWRIRPGE